MRVSPRLVGLICLIAMIGGCVTYTPRVAIPGSDTDVEGWKIYYQDQFKALGKEVQVPPADASEAQRIGYVEATELWEKSGRLSTFFLFLALGVGVGSLISTLNQVNQLN